MNNEIYEQVNGDYLISIDKNLLQIDVIHDYLSNQSYWANSIPKTIVATAIEQSICYGIYYNKLQVGFARVISDCATFAYLADVFIVPQHQDKGLGKWLIQFIQQTPKLQGLRRWLLTTKDAHGLYKQFGWQPINDDMKQRLMTINYPNIYKEQQHKD